MREVVRFWVDFEMEPARFVDGLDVKYQTESSIKVSADVIHGAFHILRRGVYRSMLGGLISGICVGCGSQTVSWTSRSDVEWAARGGRL